MEIKFENAAAKQIYNYYLNSIPDDPGDPYAKFEDEERVEELFFLAAESNNDPTLSETEAKDVDALLKQYDRASRMTLGLDNTLKEYRAWEKFYGRWDIESPEEFVNNFPNSKFVPEAYFLQGESYFRNHYDYDKAIATFEKVLKEYPASIQASESLINLIYLYNHIDEGEKAFAYSKEWLRRPPYIPRGLYSPPPSYLEERDHVLLTQAEHHRSYGNIDAAKRIYRKIVSIPGKEDYSQEYARGALYDLEGDPKFKDDLGSYLTHKYSYLRTKAEYLLYEKKDLHRAKAIAKEILSRAKDMESTQGAAYSISAAGMMLEEINLRRTVKIASDAIKAFADLSRRGGIKEFLEYQNRFSARNDFPEEIYLQVLLLKLCEDVEEVRIVNFTGRAGKIDQETKSPAPRDDFYLMFKSKGYWVLADSNDRWRTEDLDGLLKKLEKETGRRSYSVPVEGGSMLADSLRSFYKPSRLSLYESIMALEKEKAKETAPEKYVDEMFKFIKTKFNGAGDKNKELVLSFARVFSILPRSHFEKLESVSLKDKLILDGRPAGGGYNSQKIITTGASNLQILLHELTHHWDGVISVGSDGKNNTKGDPGLIYYKISWDDTNDWKKRPDAEKEDFASDYGMSNPGEDLPESAISYVFGKGNLSREKAREQMKNGNFEPAAKYLFNKYVRSFDPEDGLCFEYNITPKDPPLSLAEVKRELSAWLQAHPNSVAQSTLTAIKEIEEECAKLRAKR